MGLKPAQHHVNHRIFLHFAFLKRGAIIHDEAKKQFSVFLRVRLANEHPQIGQRVLQLAEFDVHDAAAEIIALFVRVERDGFFNFLQRLLVLPVDDEQFRVHAPKRLHDARIVRRMFQREIPQQFGFPQRFLIIADGGMQQHQFAVNGEASR